jgi:hypothetical protein
MPASEGPAVNLPVWSIRKPYPPEQSSGFMASHVVFSDIWDSVPNWFGLGVGFGFDVGVVALLAVGVEVEPGSLGIADR